MEVKVYQCQCCKKEFLMMDDSAKHCVKCGREEIVVKSTKYGYGLYNKRTGLLVE